jgi:hypothetical protein
MPEGFVPSFQRNAPCCNAAPGRAPAQPGKREPKRQGGCNVIAFARFRRESGAQDGFEKIRFTKTWA